MENEMGAMAQKPKDRRRNKAGSPSRESDKGLAVSPNLQAKHACCAADRQADGSVDSHTHQLMERLAALEERVSQLEAEFETSVPNDVEQIIVKVCRRFGLPKKMLLGRKRDADTVLARQIAVYLCVHNTKHSKTRICDFFGRHHGAVQHAVNAVRFRMEVEPKIKAEVESLM